MRSPLVQFSNTPIVTYYGMISKHNLKEEKHNFILYSGV